MILLTATGNPIFGPTSPSAGQIIECQMRCDVGITIVTASATTLWAHYDADVSYGHSPPLHRFLHHPFTTLEVPCAVPT